MIFGAPFATPPFPSASLALMRGLVQLVKPSARVLAVWGLRIEILSRSPETEPRGLNIGLHSDWSGNGGREDKGVSFGLGVKGECLEVEVEYEKEPEAPRRIRIVCADGTDAGLKPEQGTRFSDCLETRDVESIVLLELYALETGDGVANGAEVVFGW